MIASNALPARNYYDANHKIMAIFDKLDGVINSIDRQHAKGKELVNPMELFPMADEFIRVTGDATSNIHDAYVGHIQQGNSSATAEIIERETWRILKQVRNVVVEAKRLSVNPDTDRMRRLTEEEYPNDSVLNTKPFSTSAVNYSNGTQKKRGSAQTAIFEQARRLSPKYGAQFLMSIEDTFLDVIEMLKSLKEAGININAMHFPGIETPLEAWVEPTISADNVGEGIRQLSTLIRSRRLSAEKVWATKRVR